MAKVILTAVIKVPNHHKGAYLSETGLTMNSLQKAYRDLGNRRDFPTGIDGAKCHVIQRARH